MLSGHLHARAVETGLTSYPSGHEAIATALALTLWLILPKAWRWLSVLWIAIVFVSRVYLGVHTPLDVIGGFSIGLICISAIELLPTKWGEKLQLDRTEDLLEKGF
jgi:undecaprenyl-diphosphatase